MEGVFVAGFGDVGLERPGDVCSDEGITSAKGLVCDELLLDMGKRGVLPQAGCNLSAVFNRKQAKVAVALQEHEGVCLPYLFWEGTEREPGIREPRLGEGGVCALLLAVFLGLCVAYVGGDGGAPGGVIGRHDE